MNRSARTAVAAQWRVAWMTALQYRSNFIVEMVLSFFWLGWTLLPLLFVFGGRDSIAGWTADQALLVVGFFVTLEGLLATFIQPNLRAVVEHVRQGTMDFVLLKPHDAQLLLSFGRTVPAKVFHIIGGVALTTWAALQLDPLPIATEIAASAALLALGATTLYGIWLSVVSTAFWFVRVDNLSYLLEAVLEAGRWPASVFRGAVRVVFTFIIPVAVMTTYPALALRGQFDTTILVQSVLIALASALVSRWIFTRALRKYESASS